MEGAKGPVCVTGGTGYIGSWLVMRLLDHGYSVRTTIRPNTGHKRDLSFLTSLPGASENLRILNADLSDPKSFGAAIEGCVGVFHVATPIDFSQREAEGVVTKRAVDGAMGILKACLESKTVKKVVYTSSASAVVFNGKNLVEMDESFWTDIDFVRTLNSPAGTYTISKATTERAVLEFSEKHGLEVVTLIPPFVSGPFICPKLPGSVQQTLEGVLGYNDESSSLEPLDMVHVDDVARAHIFLFEHPKAKGRYNCSSIATTIKSVFELLATKYPEPQKPGKGSSQKLGLKRPRLSLKKLVDSGAEFNTPKTLGSKVPYLSSKKLTDLGFEFKYGVEEMFDEAIKCCKEKGYL